MPFSLLAIVFVILSVNNGEDGSTDLDGVDVGA
jgi:hypothetical protein